MKIKVLQVTGEKTEKQLWVSVEQNVNNHVHIMVRCRWFTYIKQIVWVYELVEITLQDWIHSLKGSFSQIEVKGVLHHIASRVPRLISDNVLNIKELCGAEIWSVTWQYWTTDQFNEWAASPNTDRMSDWERQKRQQRPQVCKNKCR